MHLRQLQLTNFRNYQDLTLDLEPGRLLFLGDNAQGKSNLLEAVQLLSSGRSVRAGSDAELIGWGAETDTQPFARLQGAVERRGGSVQLETLIVGQAAPGTSATRAGKRFRVNGIPRRVIDFVGQLRSVLFTADDLEIISGGPSARRAFLDTALSQLDRAYYGALHRYGRVLQQRNATLRRIKEGIAGQDELLLWDDSLTREGAVVIAGRSTALEQIQTLAAESHRELSGTALEDLSLRYEPQLGDEWRPLLTPGATVEAARALFAAALTGQRRRDIAAGLSLVGPHRDDVSVLLNGVSAASFGSRAQIRTAALSLRLAEARLLGGGGFDPPIVLLDDIVSELDEQRRASVLEGVAGFEQVWFTATTASWLPQEFVSEAHVFQVHAGIVVG